MSTAHAEMFNQESNKLFGSKPLFQPTPFGGSAQQQFTTPLVSQQAQEVVYPPATLFTEIPRPEQMKYENKQKYIEKNKEKIQAIKERSTVFIDQIDEKILKIRTKHFSLLETIDHLNRQYLDLKKDDELSWKAVEETAAFCSDIKKGDLPTLEDKTKYLEKTTDKFEEVIQDIKETAEKIEKRFGNPKERIAEKTLTNIFHAQQETYKAITNKYLQLVEEVAEQKERYKQIRREAYSDYSDPFK